MIFAFALFLHCIPDGVLCAAHGVLHLPCRLLRSPFGLRLGIAGHFADSLRGARPRRSPTASRNSSKSNTSAHGRHRPLINRASRRAESGEHFEPAHAAPRRVGWVERRYCAGDLPSTKAFEALKRGQRQILRIPLRNPLSETLPKASVMGMRRSRTIFNKSCDYPVYRCS